MMNSPLRALVPLCLFASLCLAGCDKKEDGKETGDVTLTTKSGATIKSSGSTFEPPLEMSELPDGAWICDMGTVHYAAGEKGKGMCPTCGMELTQKTNNKEANQEDHSAHSH